MSRGGFGDRIRVGMGRALELQFVEKSAHVTLVNILTLRDSCFGLYGTIFICFLGLSIGKVALLLG